MKVLVVIADAFHLGYLGCYGSDWVRTPSLDRLAAEGVVFDQHYADRPDPAGARRAWRTGRYQFPLLDGRDEPAADADAGLVRLLRDGGVTTALVHDYRSRLPDDFRAGWDVDQCVDASEAEDPLEQTLQTVGETLDRLPASGSWLLWVELATLVPPWQVPADFYEPYFRLPAEEEGADEDEDGDEDEEPDKGEAEEEEPAALEPLADLPAGPWDADDDVAFEQLQNSYAAAVSYLDAGIGELREMLTERGLLDDVLLVVTTDRGLPLGEHGVIGEEHPWLHDERLHLPLLVRLPGAAEAGRRVAALTQSVDLRPTLLEWFGLPPAEAHGRSLVPSLRGADEPIRPYACAGLRAGGAIEWALRTSEWAFLLPLLNEPDDTARGPQLYVKPDDRWEVNNVIQHHLEWSEHLEQTLRGFVEAAGRPGPLQAPALRDFDAAPDTAETP